MKSLRTISKLLINILCLRYQLVKIADQASLRPTHQLAFVLTVRLRLCDAYYNNDFLVIPKKVPIIANKYFDIHFNEKTFG